MPNYCAGGCGKELPASNKSGFAWGHKNGCLETAPPPSNSDANAVEEPEAEVSYVEVSMTDAQLNRIWESLPLSEKALAILTALEADRTQAA